MDLETTEKELTIPFNEIPDDRLFELVCNSITSYDYYVGGLNETYEEAHEIVLDNLKITEKEYLFFERRNQVRSLIGKRISELRKERNISQEKLAEGVSLTRHRLDQIEKGVADITYEIIQSIAMYLQINSHRITDVSKNTVTSGSEEIDEMLNFFYANKSLYNRMKN